jgi:hypothetical protein
MKVLMRSTVAEYRVLIKYFGSEYMQLMFQGFTGYNQVRLKSSFQEVFDELLKLEQ